MISKQQKDNEKKCFIEMIMKFQNKVMTEKVL